MKGGRVWSRRLEMEGPRGNSPAYSRDGGPYGADKLKVSIQRGRRGGLFFSPVS